MTACCHERAPGAGRLWRGLFPGAIAWIVLLFITAAMPAGASAYTVEKHDDQVTGQIVISPTKVELNLDPGETGTAEVVVVNRTGEPVTFQFSTEDFEGSRDASQATVFMGDELSPRGASRWLDPEVSSIVLDQGETLTMAVDVNVPPGAEPGGHYAALFASRTTDRYENGTAIKVTDRLGTLFLVRVSGAIDEVGTLDTPEVSGFLEYGPVYIGLVFNNQGNIHLKPSGQVTIRNLLGQTVAEIPVEEWIVLPDSSRRTLVKWDRRYLLGRYTATAEITYGDSNTTLMSQSSFWVIPWKVILTLIIGLLLLGFIVNKLYWMSTKRKQSPDGMAAEPSQPGAATAPQDQQAQPPGQEAMPREPGMPDSYVALNELFPSMGDDQIINLDDTETHRLVREMINNKLDLARSYQKQGMTEEARYELYEARAAAQRIGLLSEIGIIDDLLIWL